MTAEDHSRRAANAPSSGHATPDEVASRRAATMAGGEVPDASAGSVATEVPLESVDEPLPQEDPTPSGTPTKATGRKAILQGTAWQALGQFTPLLINLALTPFIISGLGQTIYGIFLVAVAVQLFIAALDGGVAASSARYFTILVGKGDTAGMTRLLTTLLGFSAITSTILFSFTWYFAPQLMGFFPATAADPEGSVFLLRSMAVIIVISQLRGGFQQVVWAHGTFAWNSLATFLGHMIYVVGMISTIHFGWGLHGIAWTQLAQQVAPTVLIMPAAMKRLDRRHFRFTDWATAKDFLSYAWKVQLSSIMNVVGSQGDIMLVGRFASAQTTPFGAGSNFAQTLGNVPMNAHVPLQTAVGHHLGSLSEKDAADRVSGMQLQWVRGVWGWVAVGAPAALFGVNAWLNLGSSLTGNVACLVLLSFGMFLLAQVQLLWAQGLGRSELALWYGLTSTVVNLGLTVILIQPFGAMGSVVATAIGRIAAAMLLQVLMNRRLSTNIASPWAQVPWLPGICGASLSGLGAWAVHTWLVGSVVPYGPVALFACGLAAAPGMALYGVLTFGVEGSKQMLGKLRRRG
ncbi:polysaccharide biosynthesis C-terminal domain-containing protein [Luteococcus sp. OSA5]|uniref:oligosaccharide flippase family protein n=1 Tax=Luteococcus sp. OSA5 TaxID=3401630 RepID=UPI003B431DD1